MGCSSSRASTIKISRDYDGLHVTEIKDETKGIRGVTTGQEIYVDIRTHSQPTSVRNYRQCQVTQSTYISESSTSLEQKPDLI